MNLCPIGFLIEHYTGNFPLWLAPDQVRVITLNDDEALINYLPLYVGGYGVTGGRDMDVRSKGAKNSLVWRCETGAKFSASKMARINGGTGAGVAKGLTARVYGPSGGHRLAQ